MSPTTACQICHKPAQDPFRPFCSKRCANIDLGRWLTEQYSIPARDTDPEDNPDSTP